MYTVEVWMQEMEALAKQKGLTPYKFCKLAGMDRSVWSHWKAKVKGQSSPLLSSALRIEKVIREYENPKTTCTD